jgi:hypothetical protein
MKTSIQLAFAVLAASAVPALQSQVARYNFDSAYEIGNEVWVPNTGTGGDTLRDINSLDIKIIGVNGRNINLATAPGVGGNGFALDLTCNIPGMANAACGLQQVASVGTLEALTVTGWMKPVVPFIKETTLVRGYAHNAHLSGAGDGFWIISSGTDTLALRLGRDSETGAAAATCQGFASLDKWVFFAVTWNHAEGVTRWFYGDESTPSAPVPAPSKKILVGKPLRCPKLISIGRASTFSVGFGGCLDDIRIFNTALAPDEIEKVRLDALAETSP